MIIGPNGTGKSTIVCAIALGLGGSPALLGRAKNIAEFVKSGETEAMIQIELKRTKAARNVIIQRTINKANNSTSWKMNGMCDVSLSVSCLLTRSERSPGYSKGSPERHRHAVHPSRQPVVCVTHPCASWH